MATKKWTVLYERQGTAHKLCKIMFGQDGSYYLTVPYHPARKALLIKQEINYAREDFHSPLDEALEVGVLEDDDARLKIAHHPDGFLQFSGPGVLSGRNPLTGEPQGIGTFSWPLYKPVAGPCFGLTVVGPQHFETSAPAGDTVAFREEDLDPAPDDNGLAIEGYYFAPPMRRFLSRDWLGRWVIRLVHPSRGVLELVVCLTDPGFDIPGFIGLEMRPIFAEMEEESGYLLSTATGNARRNKLGELIAEGLLAVFPAALGAAAGPVRQMDYRPEEPPYVL